MRFVILSRSRFLYTTRRLVAEAKLRKHDVRVASPHDCLLLVTGGQPRLLHKGKLPTSADVLIPRLTPEDWDHGISVLRALERMGVPVLNSSESLAITRDRFHTAMALIGLGLPVPPTALVPNAASLPAAVESLGGLTVQMRPCYQGAGRTLLLDQPATLETVTAMAWDHGADFVLQRVTGAGRELRLYMAAQECLGAVLRRPQWSGPSSARAGAAVEAPEPLKKLAAKAIAGLGLLVGSVDIIETHSGPLVVEVDGMPNLRGIDKAVRETVATAMVKRAETMGVARIPV
ncbi:MAG: hypothetical protein KF754_02940 [Planctomycetes bacterium]|nr:hypothetical protein [Planctomycetota bacterium]